MATTPPAVNMIAQLLVRIDGRDDEFEIGTFAIPVAIATHQDQDAASPIPAIVSRVDSEAAYRNLAGLLREAADQVDQLGPALLRTV